MNKTNSTVIKKLSEEMVGKGLTPMPSIILTPWQVRALQEGRLKQIRVPVVPQPGPEETLIGPEWYEPGIRDKYGELQPGTPVYGCYTADGEYGFRSPFQPGDILYVKETYSLNHSNHVSHTGILYQADALTIRSRHMPWAYFENGEWLDFYRRPIKGTCRRWRSPVTMPRAAARYRLTVGEVRVHRLGDATTEDVVREGLSFSYDTPEEETMTLQEAWNARYARKYPWAEGLWTFVGRVKVEGRT